MTIPHDPETPMSPDAPMTAAQSREEHAIARAVLKAIPRHSRRTVGELLHVSKFHMHWLARKHCEGRKLLSDWDVEILVNRKRKPGKAAKPDHFRKQHRSVARVAATLQAQLEDMIDDQEAKP